MILFTRGNLLNNELGGVVGEIHSHFMANYTRLAPRPFPSHHILDGN